MRERFLFPWWKFSSWGRWAPTKLLGCSGCLWNIWQMGETTWMSKSELFHRSILKNYGIRLKVLHALRTEGSWEREQVINFHNRGKALAVPLRNLCWNLVEGCLNNLKRVADTIYCGAGLCGAVATSCQQRSVEVLHHAEWVGGEGPGEKQCRGRARWVKIKSSPYFPTGQWAPSWPMAPRNRIWKL